jgi:spore germination protein KC
MIPRTPRTRRPRACLALALAAVLLAGCWDKTELNELAIVTMIGLDEDPETGQITAYYQIVNPLTSVTTSGSAGGDQAPVYTYTVSGKSFGEIRKIIYKMLPRKLFIAYYRAVVVSERMARHGMQDIVNIIQIQPTGRASVPVLIAGDPMDKIMNTLTPLEMYPGESVSLRLNLLRQQSLLVGKRIAVRDVAERMERSECVVLPILETVGQAPSPNFSTITGTVNAYDSNLRITGGAVIRDYKMVARLNDDQLIAYFLLLGNKGWFTKQFMVEGRPITMNAKLGKFSRKLGEKPRIMLHLDLAFHYAIEYMPKSQAELERMEREVANKVRDELREFCLKAKQLGVTLPKIQNPEDVRIDVNAHLEHVSSLTRPF